MLYGKGHIKHVFTSLCSLWLQLVLSPVPPFYIIPSFLNQFPDNMKLLSHNYEISNSFSECNTLCVYTVPSETFEGARLVDVIERNKNQKKEVICRNMLITTQTSESTFIVFFSKQPVQKLHVQKCAGAKRTKNHLNTPMTNFKPNILNICINLNHFKKL